MNHKCMGYALWVYLAIPVILLFPDPGRAAPANDAFASAQSISGSSGTVTGTNSGATKESGGEFGRAFGVVPLGGADQHCGDN